MKIISKLKCQTKMISENQSPKRNPNENDIKIKVQNENYIKIKVPNENDIKNRVPNESSRVELRVKTLNFKVLFIKLEYNWTKIYNYASQNASLCELFFEALTLGLPESVLGTTIENLY